MTPDQATRIITTCAGLSSAPWTDEQVTAWSKELLRFDNAEIAELVMRRLVSESSYRPTLRDFEVAYRSAMQPLLLSRQPRSGGCDGSRFTENDDGTVRPCPICSPSLARRVAEGTHHERLNPDSLTPEPKPLAPCAPASSSAVLPPSAAIIRMVKRGDLEDAMVLAGWVSTDSVIRGRVDVALAADGLEPFPWADVHPPAITLPIEQRLALLPYRVKPLQEAAPVPVSAVPDWDPSEEF